MQIFLDTADTEIINRHLPTGMIDGVTTNPTLMVRSGKCPDDVYAELAGMGLTDISMEVGGNAMEMLEEGRRLAKKYGAVATIKVPCTPDGLWVCKELTKDLIRVNVTLIFSAAQAILARRAGAAYVSPFVGRMNDNSVSGVALVQTIAGLYDQHFSTTQVLAASIRDVHHVGRCFAAGANICTIPPKVFWGMYNHVLTDSGLDIFQKDWDSI